MNKRDFLAAATVAAALPAATTAGAVSAASSGPTLLTVSGAIARSNRGPLDPVRDQMMHKHGIEFAKAYVFDAASLRRLPSVTIHPTLEYDEKVHALTGPLLETVLQAVGAKNDAGIEIGLRAVDGYRAALKREDARRWRMIVALAMDGQALALGGLGPQWAVYDADRIADFKDKPIRERFALCPWGMYSVDVKGASPA